MKDPAFVTYKGSHPSREPAIEIIRIIELVDHHAYEAPVQSDIRRIAHRVSDHFLEDQTREREDLSCLVLVTWILPSRGLHNLFWSFSYRMICCSLFGAYCFPAQSLTFSGVRVWCIVICLVSSNRCESLFPGKYLQTSICVQKCCRCDELDVRHIN
jgi:hypothetical protein